MKIVQVNHSDVSGGAARAAYRLHRGLLQSGELCSMVVKQKLKNDQEVVTVDESAGSDGRFKLLSQSIQDYIDSHRTEISNTLFSFCYPGIDLTSFAAVLAADVINLHWIAYFQSPASLKNLFDLKKPVVWTLHDQWAFTGGCHYSAGCDHYTRSCEDCPQLSDNLFNLPSRILLDKVDLFQDANLTIVTPSKWLKRCAEKSALFGKLRVEAIPNSLETDVFAPVNKVEAKEKLGINPTAKTLLFGAENGREKRKGFHELLRTMDRCKTDRRFAELVSRGHVRILVFGHAGDELAQTGVPIQTLGYVTSDTQLADIYSAADVFVLPSLEDNLPNTMLEAMSCGTPVAAFDVGGMPDVIEERVTGALVPPGDSGHLADSLVSLLFDWNADGAMSRKCRKLMVDRFSLEVQAKNYTNLYRELIDETLGRKSADERAVQSVGNPNAGKGEEYFGAHFLAAHDSILLKTLLEYVPRLVHCEADRNARLAVMHEQGAEIGRLRGELNAIKESKYWKLYSLAKKMLKK